MSKSQDSRILLIVDPQIDFINGSLPVTGAEEAMNKLAHYVREHGSEYGKIIVTADRHGFGHCSFKEDGGPWPRHCVESSVGAAIWPALMDALQLNASNLVMLYKGEKDDREEYSIFCNPSAAQVIDNMMFAKDGSANTESKQIDICGLAGDVCVADTLEDAIKRYPTARFSILQAFTASLDSGARLSTLESHCNHI